MGFRVDGVGGVFLIVSLLIVFSNGCESGHVNVRRELNIKSPPTAVKKIPMRVGIFIPPTIKNHSFSNYHGGLAILNISLGDAMNAGAEMALRKVFSDVVIIDEDEMGFANKGLDAIISPEIVENYFEVKIGNNYSCNVTAKWTVIDSSRQMIYMNTISGEGNVRKFISYNKKKLVEDCMTFALEDHYSKLLSHILSIPWWEKAKKKE